MFRDPRRAERCRSVKLIEVCCDDRKLNEKGILDRATIPTNAMLYVLAFSLMRVGQAKALLLVLVLKEKKIKSRNRAQSSQLLCALLYR